ncbi:MAG: hypothetical protein MH252_07670 [Thermosynechococcaceae cyanobacterium MS004]|nr:hypothetical protein [Thermosynechococcaceae cyanobacterium MS004]
MTRTPTIYQQLKAITIQTKWPEIFLTDLTTHDRKFLQQTQEGDLLIWTLRQDGTSLTICPETLIRQGLQRGEIYSDIQRSAKSSADMIQCNHDEYILNRKEPAARFYRIEVGQQQRGTVEEITPDKALFLTRYDRGDFHDLYRQLSEQWMEVA